MLDALIDKLTESIEEVATSRSFKTLVSRASTDELSLPTVAWTFDWIAESSLAEVYKLSVPQLGQQIHGLMSLKRDVGFVHVNLLESHPENVGRLKKYVGVPGNLVAFACQLAFELGHDGFVSFDAKTQLIEHYRQTLGAQQVGRSQRMYLNSLASQKLIALYFGDQHGTRS